MRADLTALCLTLATPALADLSLSTEIAQNGLTPTAARLAALPDPAPQAFSRCSSTESPRLR